MGLDIGDIADFVIGGGVPGWLARKVTGLPGPSELAKDLFGGTDAPKIDPPVAPPPPPDLTDQAVRLAKLAQRRRLMAGQGLGSTFISGPLGDGSAPSTSKPVLGGY
jgi:hypothetical protein